MKQGTSEKRTLRHRLSIEVGIITKKKNPLGHRRDTSREGEREGAGIGKLLGQCMIVREREREREREEWKKLSFFDKLSKSCLQGRIFCCS